MGIQNFIGEIYYSTLYRQATKASGEPSVRPRGTTSYNASISVVRAILPGRARPGAAHAAYTARATRHRLISARYPPFCQLGEPGFPQRCE